MNNLEETDRKDLNREDLITKRKGETRNLKGHNKKLQKGICFPKKYRYLEWTEGKCDNGKELYQLKKKN